MMPRRQFDVNPTEASSNAKAEATRAAAKTVLNANDGQVQRFQLDSGGTAEHTLPIAAQSGERPSTRERMGYMPLHGDAPSRLELTDEDRLLGWRDGLTSTGRRYFYHSSDLSNAVWAGEESDAAKEARLQAEEEARERAREEKALGIKQMQQLLRWKQDASRKLKEESMAKQKAMRTRFIEAMAEWRKTPVRRLGVREEAGAADAADAALRKAMQLAKDPNANIPGARARVCVCVCLCVCVVCPSAARGSIPIHPPRTREQRLLSPRLGVSLT